MKFFVWSFHVYFVFYRIEKLNIGVVSPTGKIMKIWRKRFLFLAMLIILCAAGAVHAQDAGMSDEIVGGNDAVEGDKVVYSPGEDFRYIPRAPGVNTGKDSIALHIHDFPMQQATLKNADKANEKQSAKTKDDSILTYNFLYYIIQKYKLQDIID